MIIFVISDKQAFDHFTGGIVLNVARTMPHHVHRLIIFLMNDFASPIISCQWQLRSCKIFIKISSTTCDLKLISKEQNTSTLETSFVVSLRMCVFYSGSEYTMYNLRKICTVT